MLSCDWCEVRTKLVLPLLGCVVCVGCIYIYEFGAFIDDLDSPPEKVSDSLNP